MSELTTIQEVLLETLEEELKEVVHEKYEILSSSDYLREARSFARWLVENYKRRDH